MRVVLFIRNYRKFTGGHLKTWHYFNHVLASDEFTARVWFSKASIWDDDNPWRNAQNFVVDDNSLIRPDVIFVGGRNWRYIDEYPNIDRSIPIINLVQHVRHADEADKRFEFLNRTAIRLCVSPEVAAAVDAAGSNGLTITIPNGIDVPVMNLEATQGRPVDLFIAGPKQPELATRLAAALAGNGRVIEALTNRVSREDFLAAMQRARVTLFLPHEGEGFYLPALEGMALGTIVVCPDCVGNRSFCLPGVNAFRPTYQFEELVAATNDALSMPQHEAAMLIARGGETARQNSLDAERDAFLDVLHNIDELWKSATGNGRPQGSMK